MEALLEFFEPQTIIIRAAIANITDASDGIHRYQCYLCFDKKYRTRKQLFEIGNNTTDGIGVIGVIDTTITINLSTTLDTWDDFIYLHP